MISSNRCSENIDTHPENINVHIGEIKIGKGNQVLHTLLGSCIGIGLLWPSQRLYGLAHCLLPKRHALPKNGREAEDKSQEHLKGNAPITAEYEIDESEKSEREIGGRFIDQALYSLPKLMGIQRHDLPSLEAIVAGGGNMTMPDDTSPDKLVGAVNAQFAIDMLKEKRIQIIHQDVGGLMGRKMFINCNTGHYSIKQIPRDQAG